MQGIAQGAGVTLEDVIFINCRTEMMFGARADFILGIARREEHLYMLLDLARVFSAGRDAPGAGLGVRTV